MKMPFPIEDKLVIAVASSALFDLSESDTVFREQGSKAYKAYQWDNVDHILAKGVAFPFIKRFLNINNRFVNEQPVEVVLLSRNSTTTGERVFRSIAHYGLKITRAAFTQGKSPFQYIPSFNTSLFLSANGDDVANAIAAGYPAGQVLPSETVVDDESEELRIAFDFDGVIADDESETVFKKKDLDGFHEYETEKYRVPHSPGPLADLFKKLSGIQALEDGEEEKDNQYSRILRTSIVTARGALSHGRVVTTLENWNVNADESFFLGGMDKDRVLSVIKPHMFFDDQLGHLKSKAGDIPMVHIPFGVSNE